MIYLYMNRKVVYYFATNSLLLTQSMQQLLFPHKKQLASYIQFMCSVGYSTFL